MNCKFFIFFISGTNQQQIKQGLAYKQAASPVSSVKHIMYAKVQGKVQEGKKFSPVSHSEPGHKTIETF